VKSINDRRFAIAARDAGEGRCIEVQLEVKMESLLLPSFQFYYAHLSLKNFVYIQKQKEKKLLLHFIRLELKQNSILFFLKKN